MVETHFSAKQGPSVLCICLKNLPLIFTRGHQQWWKLAKDVENAKESVVSLNFQEEIEFF